MSEPLVRAHLGPNARGGRAGGVRARGRPARETRVGPRAGVDLLECRGVDRRSRLAPGHDRRRRAAAGTSVSGLRRAFAANGQISATPEGYLGLARQRPRTPTSSRPNPATTTVEATAARWGFADAASFVAAYRAVYRTDPETTLRR